MPASFFSGRGKTELTPVPDRQEDRVERIGVSAALAAYIFWGLAPLYFKLIQEVAALEVIAHRILWSIPLLPGFCFYATEGLSGNVYDCPGERSWRCCFRAHWLSATG